MFNPLVIVVKNGELPRFSSALNDFIDLKKLLLAPAFCNENKLAKVVSANWNAQNFKAKMAIYFWTSGDQSNIHLEVATNYHHLANSNSIIQNVDLLFVFLPSYAKNYLVSVLFKWLLRFYETDKQNDEVTSF